MLLKTIIAFAVVSGATVIALPSVSEAGFRNSVHQQRNYQRHRAYRSDGTRRSDPRHYYLPHCRILHSKPAGYSAVVCRENVNKYGWRL